MSYEVRRQSNCECFLLGELLHIGNLRPWDLYSVLTQKYAWPSEKAREFADFLEPMLDYDTNRRATAYDCLNHAWIGGFEASAPISSSSSSKKPSSQSTSPRNTDFRYGTTYRPKIERGIFSAPAYGRRDHISSREHHYEKNKFEIREISKSAKGSPKYNPIEKFGGFVRRK